MAQEARLAVAPEPAALAAIAPGGTLRLGGGWYDTVLRLPDLDGTPALTVTTAQDLPETPPTAGLPRHRRRRPGRAPDLTEQCRALSA